jgi:hypothetical protein
MAFCGTGFSNNVDMELRFFYRPLRIFLQDFDATVRQYPDGVLSDAVCTTLQMGKVPGYLLTPDEASVTPDPTTQAFSLITLHTVRLFTMSRPSQYKWATRGLEERFGSYDRFLTTLESDIHQLENGESYSAWQSYYAWLHGQAGLPLGEILAEFNVQAPLWKATFTRDGMRVA